MACIFLKFYKHVCNIHLEGTVSQIFFYLGLSLDFMIKNGKILYIFSNMIFYIV